MAQTFIVHLHGVSYANEDGSSRQELVARCRPGDRLTLVAEPANPHDRNAVAVRNAAGEQLGYLPSDARDASSIARGEPVEASVLRIIGGPRWWHRLFGIQRSYGALIRLTKAEPNWQQFNAYRATASAIDGEVDEALATEKAGRIDEAIMLYVAVLAKIQQLNVENPKASAHRYRGAPVNRLSLLLERAGRREESLAAILKWKALPDPIALSTSDSDAVAKRLARLKRRAASNRGS